MKKTIQTKRNKPSGSSYRVLYAKTGRRRRLSAATTATVEPHVELESDVPNVGIGRALLVILVLHVLAIAAIYIHSTFFGNGEGEETATNGGNTPPAAAVAAAPGDEVPEVPAVEPEPVAQGNSDSSRYIVVTGDSYSRIAQTQNVDETALRALNGDRALRAGVVLDMPAELSSRPVVIRKPEVVMPANPDVVLVEPDNSPKEATPARAVEVEDGPDVSNAPKAVVVKPSVEESADVAESGNSYTIKSGDTLWSISRRFNVSREALLELNGIKDANKLYAGRTIKIPAE